MQRETIDELATDLYHHVFEVLDDYFPSHEMTGLEAGRIATLTEQAFYQAINNHFNASEPDTTDPSATR